MEFLEKTKQNLAETHRQVLNQSLGFISSAFVLIAALAWNDTIKELISKFVPGNSGLWSRLIYAVIVTIIAVIVTSRLNKLAEKYNNHPS